MTKPNRKRLFVDSKVQGALLGRALVYCVCCVLFITLPLFIALTYTTEMTFFEQAQDVWKKCGPIMTAAVLILPLALFDVLKLTNKFTGPVLRLRRELSRAAAGEHVQPMHFRTGDFWQDLTGPFNQIVQELNTLRENATATENQDTANSDRELVASGADD